MPLHAYTNSFLPQLLLPQLLVWGSPRAAVPHLAEAVVLGLSGGAQLQADEGGADLLGEVCVPRKVPAGELVGELGGQVGAGHLELPGCSLQAHPPEDGAARVAHVQAVPCSRLQVSHQIAQAQASQRDTSQTRGFAVGLRATLAMLDPRQKCESLGNCSNQARALTAQDLQHVGDQVAEGEPRPVRALPVAKEEGKQHQLQPADLLRRHDQACTNMSNTSPTVRS